MAASFTRVLKQQRHLRDAEHNHDGAAITHQICASWRVSFSASSLRSL
jgi:hypothetical protein